MKRLILFLLAVAALGQAPDIIIRFPPTGIWDAPMATVAFDNRTQGIFYWAISYQAETCTSLSLQFESAVGPVTPGAFGAFSGTLNLGINPNTSTAGATSQFQGFVSWYRVNLSAMAGVACHVSGVLYGYRTAPAGIAGMAFGNAGCVGTIATPCVVVGPTAVGATPTTNPVLVAGQDNVTPNTRILKTDNLGRLQVVGAVSTGAALAGNPVLQGLSDGDNVQNALVCTQQAAITITAGTDTVIVAGSPAENTFICHIDFVSNGVSTFTIQEGTGVTCGTGTIVNTGAYPSILSFAADYSSTGALRTQAAGDDICLHASGAVTVGGFVTYGQL